MRQNPFYSTHGYNTYYIQVNNASSVYETIKRYNKNNAGIRSIYFEDDNVLYNWYPDSLLGKVLSILDKNGVNYFKISGYIDTIKHSNNGMYREIKEYVHHDGNAHNPSCPLKHIFVNRSLLFDASNGLLKSIDIDKIRFLKFRSILEDHTNVNILLFEDHHNNQYYHVFPGGPINIDSIDYRITSEGICAIPSSKNRSQNTIRVLDPNSASMPQQNVILCADSPIYESNLDSYNYSPHKHRHHHGESANIPTEDIGSNHRVRRDVSSSASGLESVPINLVKDIWSKITDYFIANYPEKMIPPSPDTDYHIPRSGTNSQPYINNTGAQQSY
ncbi:hypothetical protein [Candidatus Cardinium hertigii]|uniref:hypothetical protein n=1 Tax=Candidatus Cardinium hertigii TaxID=247481 RepID=UPI003D7CB9A9